MGRSQETFNKKEKEKEKKRLKKRQEKEKKREERKANQAESGGGDLDSMIAYIDENGNITDTPPDLTKKKKVDADSIELGVPKRDEEEVSPFKTGRLDHFNTSKGYGFIKEDNTRESYFVHINSFLEEIVENDRVTFELEMGMKGMNAVRVKKTPKA